MILENKNILIINKAFDDNLSIGIRHKYLIEHFASRGNVFKLKNKINEKMVWLQLINKIYSKNLLEDIVKAIFQVNNKNKKNYNKKYYHKKTQKINCKMILLLTFYTTIAPNLRL